jgi:hypothetical protein
MLTAPSRVASLDRAGRSRRILSALRLAADIGRLSSMPTLTQRFEQEIGGRLYVIEASPVQANRWRAQIARRPGMPSALMPFYGATADEAAMQLVRWLTLAHRGPAQSTP